MDSSFPVWVWVVCCESCVVREWEWEWECYHEDHYFTTGVSCARSPPLPAIDDVFIAVPLNAGLNVCGIGGSLREYAWCDQIRIQSFFREVRRKRRLTTSGSVMPKQERMVPSNSGFNHFFFCSSVPYLRNALKSKCIYQMINQLICKVPCEDFHVSRVGRCAVKDLRSDKRTPHYFTQGRILKIC